MNNHNPSDDERLTEEIERRQRTRESIWENSLDSETDEDLDNLYCDECGRATHYDFEQGGRVCPKHGLQ
jgi:hypothetical protein